MTTETVTNPTPQAPRRSRLKTPLLMTGAFVVGFAGAVATTSYGQGGPFGHGMAGGPGAGPFGALQSAIEPLVFDTAIDRGIRHIAIEIDATPDQQAKLIKIAQAAAKDLLPVRQQAEAIRERGRALVVQPNLDRAAIEAFRSEGLALADSVSKRVASAIADANEVLTPDQRVKLAKLAAAAEQARAGQGFHAPWRRG
ncbi:MAG: periplasmic heavy metal sensor [Bauldia sp.]